MDLLAALRTTGSVREFRAEAVDRDVLHRILDSARFAPNGGNAQAWRTIIVEDRDKRRRLRDLYLDGWRLYLAQARAGLRPWAPLTDRDAERAAIEAETAAHDDERAQRTGLGEFAERLDEVPVLVVLLADLRLLAAVDRDLDRYTFIGGASIYPFAWSLLLAARAEGLGGVITTMPVYKEPEVKELFAVPAEFAVAAVLALGRPVREIRRLRRASVEEFATIDAFDGPTFSPASRG